MNEPQQRLRDLIVTILNPDCRTVKDALQNRLDSVTKHAEKEVITNTKLTTKADNNFRRGFIYGIIASEGNIRVGQVMLAISIKTKINSFNVFRDHIEIVINKNKSILWKNFEGSRECDISDQKPKDVDDLIKLLEK